MNFLDSCSALFNYQKLFGRKLIVQLDRRLKRPENLEGIGLGLEFGGSIHQHVSCGLSSIASAVHMTILNVKFIPYKLKQFTES
jgi:hypothetical protein